MTLRDDWLQAYSAAQPMAEIPRRTCGTSAVNLSLMEQFPVFRTILGDLEHETLARMREPVAFAEAEEMMIPVVVHVVWNDPSENVSNAQISTQIEALNRDYSGANPDIGQTPPVWRSLAGDTRIRFELAKKDPEENPHSGVTRTQTNVTSFSPDYDEMKFARSGGADGWPADQYLNIWVCNLHRVLGFAQFPGGPPDTDGVVIGHLYFGTNGTATAPFNLGRTAVHEVGHWLNLRHIWGDTADCTGSDLVNDTPAQQHPNYGAPTFPSVSCSNGPDGDMFMNYMDYVDDDAMFMFTAEQISRMHATLGTIRAGVLTSPALT